MKGGVIILALLVSGVVGDVAPYAPSGWRPSGPTLELPQRVPQNPQKQYLPPLDPRNRPAQEYGPPEVDVSVQGLPTEEQQPIFQLSPINGKQYVGPNFNSDIRNLEQNQRSSQYEYQQEIYRQFARQRQLEAQNNANRRPTPPVPRQFVPRTTVTPVQTTFTTVRPDELRTTQVDSTTEALNLNEGEVLEDKQSPQQKKQKVTVEVTKQKIQEFPPELFLSPLAQLNLQSQAIPLQLGQIRAPVFFQPAQGVSQKQVAAGYDATTHFAALPSILAQQQLSQAQVVQPQQIQNPNLASRTQEQPRFIIQVEQPANQYQPASQFQLANQYQSANQYQPAIQYQPSNQYQPAIQYQPASQYQPANQYQPAINYEPVQPQVQYPQIQAQPIILQSQTNLQPSAQPKQTETENEQDDQSQPQFIYQTYQPQIYQQPQPNQYPQEQALLSAVQIYPNQYYQQQTFQQPQQSQDGSLQSGLDVNQQGNGLDQAEDENADDANEDDGSTATAVATAFGSRIRPRVYSRYGAPAPVPRVQEPRTSPEGSEQGEVPEVPRRLKKYRQ